MIRRYSFVLLSLLAAPVLAQTASPDLSALSEAQAALRVAVASARAEQAAVPQAPVKAAQEAAPRPATLSCAAASGDNYFAVDGELDLSTMILTSARAGKSALLDSSKGEKLLDERCGSTAAPIGGSFNYEVTAPHNWGQDILQLPITAVTSGAKSFAANLHTCSYDGDWSASNDMALTCTLTVK